MTYEESMQQIETLIEAWQLDEADLNQTDINAMQVLLKENTELKKQLTTYHETKLINEIKVLKQQCKKQKEIIDKVAEYIEKHIKYECDDAYNGMQFYSYYLYDFNKQDLLDILKEGKK